MPNYSTKKIYEIYNRAEADFGDEATAELEKIDLIEDYDEAHAALNKFLTKYNYHYRVVAIENFMDMDYDEWTLLVREVNENTA